MHERLTPREAGYMELAGATKDADCEKVTVPDGVSKKLGCCNEFDPKPAVQAFRCGNCEYVRARAPQNSLALRVIA